ncbi:chemotaxis protein CheW [Duganella sp. BJB488]|uniref:Chemotaxis protein CheW n=1 Tax=Duganella vulcania TaxID=2692166 RepID=A0A845GGT1_9BURK|nr:MULTISPECIES: chemotaxis protein CheW [Duganella]MYM91939.1 chemotaxis protein CheW [Duganella vulcania]NVD72071.1 purine-binding chemotaxis protein CheW [Duganella sp. BJB1802]RFP24071.1 chemotaxis protein CheW [Duganella sp. BJB489]RFP26434.1 chemotaxis protein CheW [Duganella sp. BJB488]RFP34836.1 chemotaxis protein CheW [Duganella sp. BJB480]
MNTMTTPAQYLSFMLGQEMFAIGILAVREILEYAGVTPVPQMPACISGVINLRGTAVPVLDLARRLERAPSPIGKRTCIIVVEVDSGGDGAFVIGILVDAVNAVLDIPPAEIEPAPSFGAQVRAELLQGIGKVDGRFVLLLNVQHVVAASELAALAEGGALAQAS